MAETFYCIAGITILVWVIFDFFFTTLAQSGAAWITKLTLKTAHYVLKGAVAVTGRKAYNLSGLIINLLVIRVWIALVWLGLFFVYSSDPGSITHSSGEPADFYDRLYFTGYTLSTLGIGDYTPSTIAFKVLTACFSFFGFIFFTTAMTYLISVTSAVIHKRSLATTIYFAGKNPGSLVEGWNRMDRSQFIQQITVLQNMLDKQSINLHAFPALHYYGTSERANSLGLNLVILDEALNVILYTEKGGNMKNEVELLRKSVSSYLLHLKQNFPHLFSSQTNLPDAIPHFDSLNYGQSSSEPDLVTRRKILTGLLNSESFNWIDVYPDAEK